MGKNIVGSTNAFHPIINVGALRADMKGNAAKLHIQLFTDLNNRLNTLWTSAKFSRQWPA